MSRPGMTLHDAAALTSGRLVGDGNVFFRGIAPMDSAGPDQLAFLANRRYARDLSECRGAALLVAEELGHIEGGPAERLVVDHPHRALAKLLRHLHPEPALVPGVHPTAVIAADVEIPRCASIGPYTSIEREVTLGAGVRIGVGCVVGAGSKLGDETALIASVTVYPRVVLGARVVVHAGTRIGVDGFGFVPDGATPLKIPHVGGCVIEDDVEIGANCTIDRGSIGATVVGHGAKLDNLVHLGHNVVIGPDTMVAAQVGIAGSSRVGQGVVIGGQAGVSDHVTVESGARIGAQAGVIGRVRSGRTVSGYPARDHLQYLRAMARVMKLPEIWTRVRRLERRMLSDGGGES